MNKLKPCPFCGGEAEILEQYNVLTHIPVYRVFCNNTVERGCVVSVQTVWYDNKGEAIEAWNRRVEELQPTKRWIPVKTRPMTEEEKKYYARLEFDIDSDEVTMFESKLPNDGQKVWVCSDHGYVWQDTCEYDGGLYYLEENGDWLDIVAWMPFDEPEPYKAESEGEE